MDKQKTDYIDFMKGEVDRYREWMDGCVVEHLLVESIIHTNDVRRVGVATAYERLVDKFEALERSERQSCDTSCRLSALTCLLEIYDKWQWQKENP